MSVAPPTPRSANPWSRLGEDIRAERACGVPLPPGETSFSMARTQAFNRDPLSFLLDHYERFGPVFAIRLLSSAVVFMIGPEANHYMTVSHAKNFRWRDGSLGDLIPLLGDGLLTIDGDYHRRARRIMLPAFHRESIVAATGTMIEEAERAAATLETGRRLDIYRWTRELTLRVALRALFGIPPGGAKEEQLATDFETSLGFYGRDYIMQVMRGPKSPYRKMMAARRRLDRVIFDEIARRRAAAEHDGTDLLSLLLAARDDDGTGLSDQEVRDQVMTLLFAGHDTATSTVTFMLHELARAPHALARLYAEQDRVLGDGPLTPDALAGALPELDMAVAETLRLYPPAWIGPRRCEERFEFAGVTVGGGLMVNYCSWASHRLPEVFPEPEAFLPERFAPDARAALPKGAYVPFGGGSRTCIGMRFGEFEVKAIATALLRRCRLELLPGRRMTIRQMPTLSPRGGLEVVVRERGVPVAAPGAAPLSAVA